MTYSTKQLAEIKLKIINKINNEVDNANLNGNIESVLKKYGIYDETKGPIMVDTRTMKILVIGALAGKKNEYQKVVKEFGIDDSHVDFVDDYDTIKNYSVEKLRNSMEYSDIMVGPIPHKISNMENDNGLIQQIKQSPHEYPRLIELKANNKLKITKTNFREEIINTRYFENL